MKTEDKHHAAAGNVNKKISHALSEAIRHIQKEAFENMAVQCVGRLQIRAQPVVLNGYVNHYLLLSRGRRARGWKSTKKKRKCFQLTSNNNHFLFSYYARSNQKVEEKFTEALS